MKRFKSVAILMSALLIISAVLPVSASSAANDVSNKIITNNGKNFDNKITPAERKAAADRLQAAIAEAGITAALAPADYIESNNGYLVPDYFGAANWAYSPLLEKFKDSLPGLGPDKVNNLGQYIPVAVPDTTTYPGSDYYEIAVVEYYEQMHSDLPPTLNRGYVQLSTSVVPGSQTQLYYKDGTTPIYKGEGNLALAVDKPHYLGPAIVSESGRPVRIKFYNLLPIGTAGNLFIPVDTSVMGAGDGTMIMGGMEMAMKFTQNRAVIHLHGNNTVWISDGTPHQWITPAGEDTHYPQGVSVVDVPDMNPGTKTDGTTTLFYTNSQSARLMFYHDHSYGITRLNVYAGEAAPYLIQDQVEKDLISGTNVSGVNPQSKQFLPDIGIPLVIQDRTFVDETTILETDPTWAWGSEPGTIKTGDLWYPHVYSPAQNPWAPDGVNPFGRWMYGPWFWPPTSGIAHGPIDNPYYDPDNPDIRPPMMPATPNPSAPGESFMDTPIVNGTAYPYLEVDPKAYRFRILNAANDRFFNLQLYVADDSYTEGENGYLTEVKMVPATPNTPLPAHREQIIPDPATKGPDWIQIGNEGGFLPAPAVIESQPITWNLNLTAFNAGNIDQHSLLLGTAERADVIVDFSQYAGKTLILYNDAPAPFPASDTRYDYYTNNEDLTAEGGAPQTQPGFGPNIRTIMQIKVADTAPADPYDLDGLTEVFKRSGEKRGVFEASQETILIPQAAYNTAYETTSFPAAPGGFVQLHDFTMSFKPIEFDTASSVYKMKAASVTLPLEPKAMHDEMGEVYDEYGRMSGFLGLTNPKATSVNAAFIAYGYASPPVEIVKGVEDLDAVEIGSLDDGTQIWKITHNGVDTHTIHTHLFSAQLVNRVAWDGAMMAPDANELGWKETFRVNPLEHTIIALRPKVPAASEFPFEVPNSVRLIDPTMPEGAVLMAPPPAGWFDPQGNPIPQILNHKVNFGWEYVYHCHILSHEEMDMMHAVIAAVAPKAPENLTGTQSGNGNNKRNNLTWLDKSISETGYTVQRSATATGPWTTLMVLPANTTTYSDLIRNTNTAYHYRVFASNTVGDTETPGFPTVTRDSGFSNTISIGAVQIQLPAAPANLAAAVQQGPQVLLTWRDNASNESGFVIERSVNDGTFAALITVGARTGTGNVSYTDTTVAAGNNYSYRVAAVNAGGLSAYTNTASVTLPAPPSAPSNVAATAALSGNRNARVTLRWTDNANNETGFVIERSTNATFTANLVTVNVTANTTTYQTGNLARNTQFYFRVRAINGAGPSAWVNAAPFPILTP